VVSRTQIFILIFFSLFLFGANLVAQSNFHFPTSGKISFNFQSEKIKPDHILGPDKLRHFTGSAILTAFFYQISFRDLNYKGDDSKMIAAGLTLSLGIGKEFYDRSRENNHFCWLDLLADIAGITIGLVLVNQP
jgi:uncharacterized protein YfiM (DUF2279 family)